MRIMFRRSAQFTDRKGKLSAVYAPDVEHEIDDRTFAEISQTLLYRRLVGAGEAIVIKDTAPKTKTAAAQNAPPAKKNGRKGK